MPVQDKKTRLKRLKFRANHRGIKEMDIVLGRFANEKLAMLSGKQLDAFETLMKENDRDLLVWFTGEAVFPHLHMKEIFNIVCDHMNGGSGNA